MYRHTLIVHGAYTKEKRLAFHKVCKDSNEIKEVVELQKNLNDKFEGLSFGFHYIQTDSMGVESLSLYDSFFEGLEYYFDFEFFVKDIEKDIKNWRRLYMNKKDLKVGQVVEIKSNVERHNGLCMVVEGISGIGISGENYFSTTSYFNDDLVSIISDTKTKITKVYSRAYTRDAYKVSTEGRELLWEREEMKDKIEMEEMTIGQLMELGYEVDVTFKPKYK